ncbi:MAG: lipopolysaccharide heptosyltransferase II [Gemmataceae bacterium]
MPSDPKTIAVFVPNWIGDVVMATPAMKGLRAGFPRARIIGIGRPYVSPVLEASGLLDDWLDFQKSDWLRFGKALLAARPDTAVLFPNSLRPALWARLAGCRTVVGYDRYLRGPLLSHRLSILRGPGGRPRPTPILPDYNRIVMQLGLADPGSQMVLGTTSADDAAAAALWQKFGWISNDSVIGLNPGGAFGAAKHWPTPHFATVARACAERGHAVLVLCGPSERAIAQAIVTEANHPRVRSLATENVSIGLTKAIIRRFTAMVSTDSGPRHFAAAFDIPIVALFGPTHFDWTNTAFARETALQLKLDCGPCQQRVCPLGHHRCMTELTPAKVLDALRPWLLTGTGQEVRRAC